MTPRGQMVRGVTQNLAALHVPCGGAEVTGGHLQFLSGPDGFGGGLLSGIHRTSLRRPR